MVLTDQEVPAVRSLQWGPGLHPLLQARLVHSARALQWVQEDPGLRGLSVLTRHGGRELRGLLEARQLLAGRKVLAGPADP
eukprot:423814-Hanusia_phi.AAC.5